MHYLDDTMLHSSHKRPNRTAMLGRKAAGAQIDRIGTLLLQKKSLERKRSRSVEEHVGIDSLMFSKRPKAIKGMLRVHIPKRPPTPSNLANAEKDEINNSVLFDKTVNITSNEQSERNTSKSPSISVQQAGQKDSASSGVASSPHALSSNKSTSVDCDEDIVDSGSVSGSPILLTSVSPSTSTQIFCSVPGRLSLLCASSKYKVSVSELARRLSPPESLNASLLGGILRRAKSKNGGQTLRSQLERIGLKLPAGRRKSTNVTLLTSLVEGEAQHLAKDFANACETEFPAKSIARCSLKKCETMSVLELEKQKERFRAAKQLLSSFMDTLRQDTDVLFPDGRDSDVQCSMERFALITHTFGTPAILAGLSTFFMYVQESLDILSRQSAVTGLQLNNFFNSKSLYSQQFHGVFCRDEKKD